MNLKCMINSLIMERQEIMKEAVDKILENKDNIGLDFVVHVRNEDELNGLIYH